MNSKRILKGFILFAIGGLATLFVILLSSSLVYFFFKDEFFDFVEKYVGEELVHKEQTILNEESVIIDVVKQASNSVVSITIEQVEFSQLSGPSKSNDNIGTGFVIAKDGLIVTNQHVVSNESSEYSVTTKDKEVYKVTNIYRDEVNDIALVRIDTKGKELEPVELGDSDVLNVGQLVIAIGTQLGDFPGTATTGIVSGLNRTVTAGSTYWGEAKEYEGVIQTDAAINPGNSGGPLLNSVGQVIGINFATTSGADNVSFAIPVNVLKNRLRDFEERGGKFVKPYLGVVYQTIDEFDALRFQVPSGAFIEEVEKDSPAESGGILKGDIITEISGKSTKGGLQNVISSFKPGENVVVKIWRKTGETYREGEYIELKVKMGEKEG